MRVESAELGPGAGRRPAPPACSQVRRSPTSRCASSGSSSTRQPAPGVIVLHAPFGWAHCERIATPAKQMVTSPSSSRWCLLNHTATSTQSAHAKLVATCSAWRGGTGYGSDAGCLPWAARHAVHACNYRCDQAGSGHPRHGARLLRHHRPTPPLPAGAGQGVCEGLPPVGPPVATPMK